MPLKVPCNRLITNYSIVQLSHFAAFNFKNSTPSSKCLDYQTGSKVLALSESCFVGVQCKHFQETVEFPKLLRSFRRKARQNSSTGPVRLSVSQLQRIFFYQFASDCWGKLRVPLREHRIIRVTIRRGSLQQKFDWESVGIKKYATSGRGSSWR